MPKNTATGFRGFIADLDELLSQQLIFTNHLGQLISKEEDLDAHQSGRVKLDELTPTRTLMHRHDRIAIVSVLVHLKGRYNGIPGEGDFRFTRVWEATDQGKLHLIAGHACVVAPG